MGFFSIVKELDDLDKEGPLIVSMSIGSFWGVTRIWTWKFGDAAAVVTTGLAMGISVGAIAGYFWYFSFPTVVS